MGGIARRIRRWPWKRIGVVFGGALALMIAVTGYSAYRECRTMPPLPAAPADGGGSVLDERYRRDEDNTYLTFPEWYIVYSAEEYAATLKGGRPSRFPYVAASGQYWCAYARAYGLTKGRYAFNGGYHLTLGVIGASFTVEELIKGAYENSVGRVFEWLSFGQTSTEDDYAREVAEQYGAFLHTLPWYEFPFGSSLAGLWKLEPFGVAPPAEGRKENRPHPRIRRQGRVRASHRIRHGVGVRPGRPPDPRRHERFFRRGVGRGGNLARRPARHRASALRGLHEERRAIGVGGRHVRGDRGE